MENRKEDCNNPTIVCLAGGLGNQMFQYAFGFSLMKIGYNVKFDLSWLDEHRDELGENYLPELFNLHFPIALSSDFAMIKEDKTDLFHRIGRKVGLIRLNSLCETMLSFGSYNKRIVNNAEGRKLTGYWQTEEYFRFCKSDIKKSFLFNKSLNDGSKKVLEIIKETSTSVSIHVRLGDYADPDNHRFFGGICTKEYYQSAFDYIEKKVENPIYFLFSNEPEKASQMMNGKKFYLVDCNNAKNGWNDMALMSQCDHHIIANSTFSWWAAYLNGKDDKEVIIPKNWINGIKCTGLYVDGWTKM